MDGVKGTTDQREAQQPKLRLPSVVTRVCVCVQRRKILFGIHFSSEKEEENVREAYLTFAFFLLPLSSMAKYVKQIDPLYKNALGIFFLQFVL